MQLPQRQKKRRRLYRKDSPIIRMRSIRQKHVWAIDFVQDKLSNGRSHKILTILKEFTQRGLAVKVRTKMGAEDILAVLYLVLLRHGSPEYFRSNNGPEFLPKRSRTGFMELVSGQSVSIPDHPGRTVTTNGIMASNAKRFSMQRGSG